MKVLVLTVDSPFIRGGAEIMLEQLVQSLKETGRNVEIIRLPFTYSCEDNIAEAMDFFERFDLGKLDSGSADRVIYLKFPTYYAFNEAGRVWLMHQHRPYYDLFDASHPHNVDGQGLRSAIVEKDTHYLSRYEQVFTISQNVSKRLRQFNGIESIPIYQPPCNADFLCNTDNLPVIFCPSRIEDLKRQELLVRAMTHVRSPMVAIIAGTGGKEAYLRALADQLGVTDRIVFTGAISDAELIRYYGLCRAVFFAPFDEDYGFVTLEAMLASKPVITCWDSGGPLEFVNDGANGFVLPPEPEAIAQVIEHLSAEPQRAAAMGRQGRSKYLEMNLSWHAIADQLTI